MIIVTPTEFSSYINNWPEDDNELGLHRIYCETAQSIIEGYVGYTLTASDYTETIYGELITLKAFPINSVASLVIDGVELTAGQYEINKNQIKVIDDSISVTKKSKTVISYNAGYSIVVDGETSYVDIPSLFKSALLKIASLLFLEQGGNIGVTGLSTDNGVNRTFINYNNYSKHLQILSTYKVIRF